MHYLTESYCEIMRCCTNYIILVSTETVRVVMDKYLFVLLEPCCNDAVNSEVGQYATFGGKKISPDIDSS